MGITYYSLSDSIIEQNFNKSIDESLRFQLAH